MIKTKTSIPAYAIGLRNWSAAISACCLLAATGCVAGVTERPYLAVNELEMRSAPEALMVGSFVRRNQCIQFIPWGMTTGSVPVFPRGTTLTLLSGDRFQLKFGKSTIREGVEYEVGGGPVNLQGHGGIRLPGPIPAGCPASTIVVGDVSEVSRRR